MVVYMPPGWPTGVHPPGSEQFERTAVTWLLDVVPPDYRMHGVLRRHPIALATLARRHLAACVEGARQGYRTARTELGGVLPVSGLDAVLAAYRSEGSRLVTAARAADLVEQALRGTEFTPPLQDAPGRPGPARSPASPGSPSPSGSPAPSSSPAPAHTPARPGSPGQDGAPTRPGSPAPDRSPARPGSPAPDRSPAPSGSLNPSRPVTPPGPPTPSDPLQLPEVSGLDDLGPPGPASAAEPSGSSARQGQQATPQKRRQKAATPGKQQKQPSRGKQRRPQTVG